MSSWTTFNIVTDDPDSLVAELREELDQINPKYHDGAGLPDLTLSWFTSGQKTAPDLVSIIGSADTDVDLLIVVTANDTTDGGSMTVYDPDTKWGAAENHGGDIWGGTSQSDEPQAMWDYDVFDGGYRTEYHDKSVNEKIEDKYGIWPLIGGNYSDYDVTSRQNIA